MSKKRRKPGSSSKPKAREENRLAMFQDFHPAINDPQYVEKLRALYPDIECPEMILDLGYQVIYPGARLSEAKNPFVASKKPLPSVEVRDLTPLEIESLKREMKESAEKLKD
jgi:hypothetical protein